MATLRFTRDELIAALEARRPWAERLDAEHLAEHQKAEKAYLARFRAACREAVKWDYETAKAKYFTVLENSRFGRPECPTSLVAGLDRHLNMIKASRQKSFAISDSGGWSRVFHLLTHDDAIKAEMC